MFLFFMSKNAALTYVPPGVARPLTSAPPPPVHHCLVLIHYHQNVIHCKYTIAICA